jgi:Carboxypeptidase regulatory-like domain
LAFQDIHLLASRKNTNPSTTIMRRFASALVSFPKTIVSLRPSFRYVSGIKGTVVSENLKPIKDALVRICSSDGELRTSTVTDRDSRFLFSDLAPGDYWLLISKNGYETTVMSVTVGAGVLDVGMIVLEKDRQAGNDLPAVDSELLEKVCSGGP